MSAIADVEYFFQLRFRDTAHTLALVSVFSPPDQNVLELSHHAAYICHHRGTDALTVVHVKSINSVVAMVPDYHVTNSWGQHCCSREQVFVGRIAVSQVSCVVRDSGWRWWCYWRYYKHRSLINYMVWLWVRGLCVPKAMGRSWNDTHPQPICDSCFLPYSLLWSPSHRSLCLPFFLNQLLRSCLFCVVPMDIDSSGLAGTLFSETRHHPTPDFLHTPNTSHTQFFNQSTGLLVDRMHDVRTTPDSSPMVSAPTVVCASKYSFFLQNVLSSPLELRLSRATDEQLMASGNTVYLQSQLVIECQRWKIMELENQIRTLELDVVIWKTRHTSTQWVSLLFPATSVLSHHQ